jgi:hypothetical protein
MKKILILTVLALALVATQAFASVQNVKVSGDVSSTWLKRDRFDLGGAGDRTEIFQQNLFLTQTRLRVDSDLTDNVSATVALINERAWNQDLEGTTDGANDIDINLAYVTLREMLYSPLTVIIGRQNFAYGNSFIMSTGGNGAVDGTYAASQGNRTVTAGGLLAVAEDLSKRRAMDAIRMVLDYNPLTIDVVYAKLDANNLLGSGVGALNLKEDDVNLYGINANYQLGDKMNTVVEGYFWTRHDQSMEGATSGRTKPDTIYLPGLRVASNVLKDLSLSGELAWQFGRKYLASQLYINRSALGGQVIATYKAPFEKTKKYNPVLSTSYTYVSGDSNPTETLRNPSSLEDTYTAWEPFYENQGTGKILNTLFNLTNVHAAAIKGTVTPIEDLTASVEWTGLWLDKALSDMAAVGDNNGTQIFTLYQPDGGTVSLNTDKDLGLGQEIDLGLVYDYTEDVQIGATYGWFIPGTALTTSFAESSPSSAAHQNEKIATQAMISASVAF